MLGWLTGGIFLGWSLGANDASNVFGTAVGTRSIRFRTAVICICVFCMIGALLEGTHGIETISGITEQSPQSAFITAISAALTVTVMTFLKMPVSTSQAVVGAIIGISFGMGQTVDFSRLAKVVICWVGTPLGAMLISIILYFSLGHFWNKYASKKMYLMDNILRWGLVIAGSYGAYALGANNVANVTGVFAGTGIGNFSPVMLAFIGAVSICIGVITYSKRVMMTVGENLVPLAPFTAFIAVLSEALTVHIYAMVGVPVSTSQAIVGAVLGIGFIKGMRSVNNKVLVGIVIGWISTPVVAGIVSYILYSLFF